MFGDAGLGVWMTASGMGSSVCDGHALTRWTGDRVEDPHGWFVYLRDLDSGRWWSAGRRPSRTAPDWSEAVVRPGRVDLRRIDQGIECCLEACVAPSAAVEIRRITLVNRQDRPRRIECTTYAEVVLLDRAADASHPGFAKLFLETEAAAESGALLVRRRPRSPEERHPLLVHALLGDGPLEIETDRARFVGRGRSPFDPIAMVGRERLSGTVGNVLDPIVSARRVLTLPPRGRAVCVAVLGAAATRGEALALARIGRDALDGDAVFAAAEAREVERWVRTGIDPGSVADVHALLGAALYRDPAWRVGAGAGASPAVIAAALADVGIAGMRPIVIARARLPQDAAWCAELSAAHRYAADLGVPIDVVVLADGRAPETGASRDRPDDGFRVRPRDAWSDALALALETVADVVLAGGWPGRTESTDGKPTLGAGAPPPFPGSGTGPAAATPPGFDREPLLDFNGWGGFSAGGDEYVIRLPFGPGGHRRPPQPWINVMANPEFGCLVSESGAGSTWSRNSREHRLTPWSNDPVVDPHGEALYLRDEASGRSWSPFPGPRPHPSEYEVRHGLGSTTARLRAEDLDHETCLFVAAEAPARLALLRLTDRSGRPRRLSLFAYHRLCLGAFPESDGRHVSSRMDAGGRVAFAERTGAEASWAGPAFLAASAGPAERELHFGGDRAAFIGYDRGPDDPRALSDPRPLEARFGTGLDAALNAQVVVEVPAHGTIECVFVLGHAADDDAARDVVARLARPDLAREELGRVRETWRERVSTLRIATPRPELDRMVNAWLPYQDLSCRIWGRTAFYQSGGAFGFRDQLQDAAALETILPHLTRGQILLHAAHQFEEGDVLHWWHPPHDRGLRTRFVDDLLWLPWAVAGYLRVTGDDAMLDEVIRFVRARPLAEGEDEAFLVPEASDQRGDLYEHCVRALDRSLAVGVHGLPKFGSGDWNDGMNRVGREGRGESVWMGFFLFAVLGDFLPLCERRGDATRVARYRGHREALRRALEDAGWDGAWYRRGYYDDGAPLGSKDSDECQIDALAQAWAALSGAAPAERVALALDAVEERLVAEPDGLIRLLAPPFRDTPHDPGYIKGYVAGVRENGGQYTHAALWFVRAMAEAGRRERATELLAMLSPVSHGSTPSRATRYGVEPYVVAADVYGAEPHVGRGGWTWYTGSAGWMYRVAIESILGFSVRGGRELRLRPCVPDGWPGFRIDYRVPGSGSRYAIVASCDGGRAGAVISAHLDGAELPVEDGTAVVPLQHDGRDHFVELRLG
jgi:cyclic beta-1,2-glucan synthetase